MDTRSDKPTGKPDAEDSDEQDLNPVLRLVAQPSLAEFECKIGDLRGQRLGRYELQSAIGRGGMGTVYHARDQTLGRDVAVKVLARIPTLGQVSNRFLFEARAGATIDHPSVARIYDVGDDHGILWFAMEYIRGESIRSRLRRGPIELTSAVEIAIQIASALKAIHDHGFLHRDLKPENVMLTDGGRVKVVDFGLARNISRTDQSADQLTMSGQFLGTPGYVSPEQATGGPLDARSDIFAFGILLCEMLVGVHPFQRETPAKTTLALMRDEPAIPAVRVQSLRETIHRALAKEPEARHQSSGELLRALQAAEKEVAGGCRVNPMEEVKRSIGTAAQTLLATLLNPATSSAAHHAPLPLEQFLRVGTQIARGLAEYHEQNGVHGRLSPANIVLFATEGYAEIKSAPATCSGTTTLEHWIYLAPEQTGRFERPIDVRSDLYVLGVILYELLVGALPFMATDALSWIHSHLAKSPRAPNVALPTIPQTVSDIVMKLLAKGPEDRYHTARGLEQDLERCRADWERAREISPFLLGERGAFDRFTIPQKVYGRDDERAALLAALTKVIDGGQPRIFLLGGGPGVGKTALVRELAKPVAAANGFFCTAKFDQLQRDVPYAPIVQAFRDLITLILAANDERILAWRRRLAEAVGINGGLITDLLPEAQLIIGVQPPVVSMPPLEAHRRFVDVFTQFMQVFANAEHPLVLFLDDLQWADSASLRLLSDVVSQVSLHSLLFIGAYRDNEVGPDHALHGVSRELEAAGTPVDTLALGALGVEPLERIVADTLHLTREACAPLTALLFDKTRGNPFFFIRFLAMLHRSGLVRFDRATGWTWDTGSIEAHDFSDNVNDLMTRQFRHCPPETAHALSLAACLGNSFDLEELAAAAEQSLEKTAVVVERAIEEGLVVRTMNSCRFVHDRMQQAAYARIPDDRRAATHLSIGRILLARTKEDDLPDRVFDLLSQLNRGVGIVDDERERERLARLNLMAARRARASAAFRAAADYGATGLQLLSPDSFGRTRDLAFALCLECADCELATGNLGAAERYLASAQTHAQSRGDRAACWRGVINLHTARSQPMAALEAAFQCLRLFDLNLSLQPAPSEVQKAERAMFERLGESSIEAVAELPLMGESDIEAAMNVLAGTLPNAYFVDLDLHRLVACHMVDLTLCHGLCALSPLGVAAYGMELAISGQYEEAERFGRAALASVDRHRFSACRAGVLQILGASLAVWTQGIPAAIELLRASARAGLESGEAVVAAISRIHVLILMFASGAPLDEVEREADRTLDVSRSAGYAAVVDAVQISKRMVQALRRRGGQDLLAGPDFHAFVERVLNHPLPLIGPWFHVHALPAFVVFGQTQRALAAVAATRQTIVLVRAQHAVADRAFYAALAMTAAWDDTSADVRAERAAELRECDEQLRLWATTCPRGYFHLSVLVRAEIARIEGRFDEAVAMYERAILAARDCDALHVEALAHERASAAFWTRGLTVAAELHLREARRAYVRWGALAKVEQLDRQWPDLALHENRTSSEVNGLD